MRNALWLGMGLIVAQLVVAGCSSEVSVLDSNQNDAGQGGQGGQAGSAGAAGSAGTAGSAGQAGSAGAAGWGMNTTAEQTDKIDLLFVVDNSASMADKQNVLHVAVRDLVSRLTNPLCVDKTTGQPIATNLQPQTGTQACPEASKREFLPQTDIHVGVISTSLGGHGGKACSPADGSRYNPHQDDKGHLLSRGPGDTSVQTYADKGFLLWDPQQVNTPPGESDSAEISERFGNMVLGVAEDGCGYESTLESWYRFLIDPAPYESMVPVACNASDPGTSCRGPQGVDATVLQQRAEFLRPDSLVAVIMLSDENDCSIYDGGQAFFTVDGIPGAPFTSGGMFRGTAACETDPNSPDCMPCYGLDPAVHPECADPWLDALYDSNNLRCYRQKQRFGVNYLQPVKRYVDGLTKPMFEDGTLNPLFCSDRSADGRSCNTLIRNPSLVVLTGIVGVPWQDIARNPADLTQGYRLAEEIPWANILGDPANNIEPQDPLMVEAIDPRSGTNPATGQALAAPSSPLGNTINGSEWNIPTRNDLQYSCIFDLPEPIDCSDATGSCDCRDSKENPLCWNSAAQSYGKIQYRAKAYPSLRQLSVLKDIGAQAVVASICPANMSDTARDDYGYRPAMTALAERMKRNLKPQIE